MYELVGLVPWTFVAQICNLFIQMYLIKRFLFKPVNEMLEKEERWQARRLKRSRARILQRARTPSRPSMSRT